MHESSFSLFTIKGDWLSCQSLCRQSPSPKGLIRGTSRVLQLHTFCVTSDARLCNYLRCTARCPRKSLNHPDDARRTISATVTAHSQKTRFATGALVLTCRGELRPRIETETETEPEIGTPHRPPIPHPHIDLQSRDRSAKSLWPLICIVALLLAPLSMPSPVSLTLPSPKHTAEKPSAVGRTLFSQQYFRIPLMPLTLDMTIQPRAPRPEVRVPEEITLELHLVRR